MLVDMHSEKGLLFRFQGSQIFVKHFLIELLSAYTRAHCFSSIIYINLTSYTLLYLT